MQETRDTRKVQSASWIMMPWMMIMTMIMDHDAKKIIHLIRQTGVFYKVK